MSASPSITRVVRIGLVTAALDDAIDFMVRAFDAEIVEMREEDAAFCALMGLPSAKARQAILRLGAQEVAFVSFDPPGRAYPEGSTSSDLWFQHFAIIVSDMAAAYARLREVGRFSPISEQGPETLPPRSGSVEAFKFRDAEGHPLELLAFPEGKGPDYWERRRTGALVLGVDHSAISVTDTKSSLAFFNRSFGLVLGTQSENYGSEQAAMDAVPDARVTVSGVMPQNRPPHVELLGYRTGLRRPIEGDVRSNDIAASHFVLETCDLPTVVRALTDIGATFVSPGIVTLRNGAAAIMVQDLDGHRFIVVQAERLGRDRLRGDGASGRTTTDPG